MSGVSQHMVRRRHEELERYREHTCTEQRNNKAKTDSREEGGQWWS